MGGRRRRPFSTSCGGASSASVSADGGDLLAAPLDAVLAQIASPSRGPGGGSAAAIVAGLGAALVAMSGRLTRPTWAAASAAVAQAEALRARAAPLADADSLVYAEASALLELPGVDDADLGRALAAAADVPLRIAEVAADVALLAEHVVSEGPPEGRGDAAVGAALAVAAARAAAHLVEINLGATAGDIRVLRARALADLAERSAEAALTPA
jgi:formiminotetrahydrofolate cyclodeaminase